MDEADDAAEGGHPDAGATSASRDVESSSRGSTIFGSSLRAAAPRSQAMPSWVLSRERRVFRCIAKTASTCRACDKARSVKWTWSGRRHHQRLPREHSGQGARPFPVARRHHARLSDTHVNILSASVTTTRDRIATSRFTFEMADQKHLGSVLKTVRTVEGVYDAYRVWG